MSQFCTRFFRILIVFFVVAHGPISCGTNSATIADSGTELSSAETNAFDSGPADMLPTIAKLESLDADSVDVEFVSMTGSSSNLTAYLTSSYLAANTTDCDYDHYQVTVSLGATTFPYVYAANLDTGGDIIAEVSKNIDTVFCLRASEGDYFTLSAMDATQQYISPVLIITQQNGVTTITPTNSSSINSAIIPVLANNGLYFSVKDAGASPSTYSLYRKNLGGDLLEVVAEGFVDSPYQLNLEDIEGLNITLMDTSGRLQRLTGEQGADETVSWSDPETLEEDAISASIDDGGGRYYIKVFSSSNGHVFLTNNYFKDSINQEDSYVLKIYAADGQETVLLEKAGLMQIDFVKIPFSDTLFAIEQKDGEPNASLYEIDLSDGVDAWTNKTRLVENAFSNAGDSIYWGSNFGEFIFTNGIKFDYLNISDPSITTLMERGALTVNDANFELSQIAAFSPSGKYFSVILTPMGDPGYCQMFIHRVGVDPLNTGYLLPKTQVESCVESMLNFDENDRLIYYNSDLSDTEPQLTIVDLNNIDFDNLTPIQLEVD